MPQINNTVKPSFFCENNVGQFVCEYLSKNDVSNVFAKTEDGDFVLNLLAHQNVDQVHACDLGSHGAMTLETKKALLQNSNFEDSEEYFCGQNTHKRLLRTGRWDGDSFALHKKRDTHVRYLSTIEEFHRVKTQLHKIKVYTQPIFDKLDEFHPGAFDLIYLGRIFDQPSEFSAYNWPATISSRLKKKGHLMIRTNQDQDYLTEIFDRCGFELLEYHDAHGPLILLFTHKENCG